jgi:hypothetical protein
MCDVPRDIQRRFEQRWAARFARPLKTARPEKHQPEKLGQPLAAPLKAQRKARQVEPAGLRPLPTVYEPPAAVHTPSGRLPPSSRRRQR